MPANKKICKKEASLLCYHSYAATDSLSQPLPLTDEEMRSTHASLAIKQFQLDHQTGSSIGRRREDTTGCGPVNRRLNRLSYRRVTGKTPDFALLEGVSGFKSSLRRKIFFSPPFHAWNCFPHFSLFNKPMVMVFCIVKV